MNTIKINSLTGKDDIIKQVNKFRLENKNKWYQVEIKYSPNRYKLKCFNTWVQIAIIETPEKTIQDSSNMDISVKEFKNYLQNLIR